MSLDKLSVSWCTTSNSRAELKLFSCIKISRSPTPNGAPNSQARPHLSKLPPVDWRNLQIPLLAEDGKYYQDPTAQEHITRPPTLLDSVSVTVGVLTPSHHMGPPPGSRYNTQPSSNPAGRGSRTRPSYDQTDPCATSRQSTNAETDVLNMFAQFQDMQDWQKRDRDRPWYMPHYPPQFVSKFSEHTRVISHHNTHPIKSLPPYRIIQFISRKTVLTGPTRPAAVCTRDPKNKLPDVYLTAPSHTFSTVKYRQLTTLPAQVSRTLTTSNNTPLVFPRCNVNKHHLPTFVPSCPHSLSPHKPLGHHTPTKTSPTPQQHTNSITQSPLASANYPQPRKHFKRHSPVLLLPPSNLHSETLVIAYANTDGFSLLKWRSLLTLADEHDIDIFLVVESHLGPGTSPPYIQQSGWVALSAPGIPQGASHHGQFRAGLLLLYRLSAHLTATISQDLTTKKCSPP